MFGFLNINKPPSITSFNVISILRKIFKIKQIGHAGTLDPLAAGVLPIAIGKASRLLEYLDDRKEYICGCEFGKISDTYDIEGKVEKFSNKYIDTEELNKELKNFKGEIFQTPPIYSAVHYKGKRLYEIAREGKTIDKIPTRKINVYRIELLEFSYEKRCAKILIECSKGTYIRSIVNDLGKRLDTGAIMTELSRTKSGGMTLDKSVTVDELLNCDTPKKYLINPIDVLSFRGKELSETEYRKVIHGNALTIDEQYKNGEIITLVKNSELIAMGMYNDNRIEIKKVLI